MSVAKPKVIAHRGGRRWAPENTMAAFKLSLSAGVDGIELDIHRCSTGELVVIHDDDVNRTTDSVGNVQDISWAELQRLDAGSWFDPRFSDERIPSLRDVLDLIAGKIILNIEVKNTPIDYSGIEEDLLELLQDYPKETIIISSFDHKLMQKFAKLDSSLNIALLADGLFIDVNAYAKQMNAKFWHPCFGSLREDAVEEAHAGGLQINAWTVNAPRDWAQAVIMKLEGIVTDDPEGLISYLNRVQVHSA
jgi:glycerophosphoryl diester phosphodiesterase